MQVRIEPTWKDLLVKEFEKPYFQELIIKVRKEYLSHTIYPRGRYIFEAFSLCPLPKLKVVILGQDPYHNPKQAHGLSFSVPTGVAIPPSLRNIYKEIKQDVNVIKERNGNLSSWSRQGVLLLNAFLTVRAYQPASHRNLGWHRFTDEVIRSISKHKENIVFLLWGSFAVSKSKYIDKGKHFILTAPHPSPLSAHRGFFGCKHFSQTNDFLQKKGISPIKW